MNRCSDTGCLCARWDGTREGAARLVADSYRTALHRVARGWSDDPAGDLSRMDMLWHDHDVHWPVPRRAPVNREAWVSAVEAALYADVKPSTIRKWAERKMIRVNTTQPINRYNIGDLDDLAADRYRQRHEQRKHIS